MSFIQQSPSGTVTFEDWLKAWKSWAVTRKRGKMAQFIVQKLEESKQAKWLDITNGKFQLTDWHNIAEEWFKQKPRSSDQIDAPCMLRKGLPRAFPGLDEIKAESIKEGTQYRSRVFQAPTSLIQEVHLYIKPVYVSSQQNGYPAYHQSYTSQPSEQASMPTSTGLISMPYAVQHYSTVTPDIKTDSPHGNLDEGYMVTARSDPHASPSVKYEDHFVDVCSPLSSETAVSSPYSNSGNFSGYNGVYNGSPYTPGVDTLNDGHGSPYNGSGPYSHEGASPIHGGYPVTTAMGPSQGGMLQVPPGDVDSWSNSTGFSPETNGAYQTCISGGPPVSPLSAQMDPILSQQSPVSALALLQVQSFPDTSPLEGGGQVALLFTGELPVGTKWLSFNSLTRPEYIHQVEAVQGNDMMALTAVIPKHDIPETVTLQVMANGQLIAQTVFTYYASPQFNSDVLFQYLAQSFPDYFPNVTNMDIGPGGNGGTDGGYYYSGNIPATSYSLLLGTCRLGIEPLVYATLELDSMTNISNKELLKAHQIAAECGHTNLADVLKVLSDIAVITAKGRSRSKVTAIRTERGREVVGKLDHSGNPKESAEKVLSWLSNLSLMERRAKVEGEKETADDPPALPTIEADQSDEGIPRRRAGSNRLQRQDNPISEEDELQVPAVVHSRKSIAEVDDTVPPLSTRPRVSSKRGRKMLVSTHSDAADSAVSMSFDAESTEYVAEAARRNSARDASLGLFQFNKQSEPGISVTVNSETGYTLANSLQYECSYQVTEDYPPNADHVDVIFRAGDKIVQIGESPVHDKSPDDFALLLQTEACKGTSVRIIPRLNSGPTSSLSLGYGSLDVVSDRSSVNRRQSDLMSSLSLKISNLLSMKAPGHKRIVTLPRTPGEGFGFKLTGGNSVGLFISEVQPGRDEIKVGDQVLEIAGESTLEMTHYAATQSLKDTSSKVVLKVMENTAKFQSTMLQFEYDSFYIRTHVDHTPSDNKEMSLKNGGFARVVNCTMDSNYWLAWSVDTSTGADLELRRIPAPHKAHEQFGKHVYETVPIMELQDLIES